jgi:hypothetical protein
MRVRDWLGKVNFRYRRNYTLVLMTMHIYLVEGRGNTERLHPEDWLSDIQWLPATKRLTINNARKSLWTQQLTSN